MKRVNILSKSRFHLLDLARELDKNGFDVRFYSYVPKSRCIKFGLRKECVRSMTLVLSPFLVLTRLFPKTYFVLAKMQDFLLKCFMRKCDVCISLTGFISAPLSAKKRGATLILERGSKHILEQDKIISKNPYSKSGVPPRNIRWDLRMYPEADYIAIATQHVRESFLLHNYPDEKLFVNPYGVDLRMFKPLPDVEKDFDVIMVGGWSYRKGCDLIVDAIRATGYRFLHVGGLVDLPFPQGDPQFTHVDPVDQRRLINYYNRAKVFVLPSREEGLAMVQAQAIACNLPLVGSHDSGAEDLKRMVEQPEYVTIIRDYTAEAVAEALQTAMKSRENLKGTYAGKAIENLTWEAYGKRYAAFLNSILKP